MPIYASCVYACFTLFTEHTIALILDRDAGKWYCNVIAIHFDENTGLNLLKVTLQFIQLQNSSITVDQWTWILHLTKTWETFPNVNFTSHQDIFWEVALLNYLFVILFFPCVCILGVVGLITFLHVDSSHCHRVKLGV